MNLISRAGFVLWVGVDGAVRMTDGGGGGGVVGVDGVVRMMDGTRFNISDNFCVLIKLLITKFVNFHVTFLLTQLSKLPELDS